VNDEVQLRGLLVVARSRAREGEDDPFSEARDPGDRSSLGGGERGLRRPEDEGARETDSLERMALRPGDEVLDVDLDVGKLRHGEPSL
jgi:hypothetical protein